MVQFNDKETEVQSFFYLTHFIQPLVVTFNQFAEEEKIKYQGSRYSFNYSLLSILFSLTQIHSSSL